MLGQTFTATGPIKPLTRANKYNRLVHNYCSKGAAHLFNFETIEKNYYIFLSHGAPQQCREDIVISFAVTVVGHRKN